MTDLSLVQKFWLSSVMTISKVAPKPKWARANVITCTNSLPTGFNTGDILSIESTLPKYCIGNQSFQKMSGFEHLVNPEKQCKYYFDVPWGSLPHHFLILLSYDIKKVMLS